MRYPVFTPTVTAEDISAVSQSIASGWISSNGPYIKDFETSFAK